jgi:hypothetical protein
MRLRAVVPALVVAAAVLATGCRESKVERHDTAVLGGSGPQADRMAGVATITDARGEIIPAPPAPAGSQPQLARSGDEVALAVWLHDDRVLAASWQRADGWSAAQPLEEILGEASAPQLVSNGRGAAMAVWQHRVGNIHSLRFSRFDAASGWSVPDVLPGALPRPPVAGSAPGDDGPRLQMDAEGNVLAQWPSGFRANEMQSARYAPAQGWSRPASEPVAVAPGAPSAR